MAQIFFNKSGRRPSAFATLGLIVMLLAFLSLFVAWPVLGYFQLGSLYPESLFSWRLQLLSLTRIFLMIGAAFTIIGILHGRFSVRVRMSARAFMAVVVGGLIAAPLAYLEILGRDHPLHDLTTDIGDPPHFELLAERSYDTATEASMQGGRLDMAYEDTHHARYPSLQPVHFNLPAETLLVAAKEALAALGWQRPNGTLAQNQLEGTAKSPYLFLETRVVLRVRSTAAGERSVLDFRALSPVGVSDYGMGERRFQEFMTALNQQLAA